MDIITNIKRILHCIKADFQEKRGGNLLEGKFPSNPRKLCLVSQIDRRAPLRGVYAPYNLGNLPDVWDSVEGKAACRRHRMTPIYTVLGKVFGERQGGDPTTVQHEILLYSLMT
jgi:hypothetical protein